MKNEIKSLTGLRGIAAIWVMFLHYYAKSESTLQFMFESHNYVAFSFFGFVSRGYIAVDLFFILSAFVLFLSNKNKFETGVSREKYGNFMKNRFIRVYPLYFFYVIVYFILAYISNNNIQSPLYWIVNITFLGFIFSQFFIVPVIWSLCVEWWMYTLMPLIMRYVKTLNSSILLLFAGILILILLQTFKYQPFIQILNLDWTNMLDFQEEKNMDFPIGINAMLRCIADYFIGIFFFFLATKKTAKNLISKYWYIILSATLVTIYFTINDTLLILLLGLLMISILGNNLLSRILSSKAVYFAGLISYSIYLNHYIYITFFNRFESIPGGKHVQFSLIFVLTILSSIITYFSIEKYFTKIIRSRILSIKQLPIT